MTCIQAITPLLECISGLSGLLFQVRYNGRPILSTRGFEAKIGAADLDHAIQNFSACQTPFQTMPHTNGITICGAPLEETIGTDSWFIALAPGHRQNAVEEEVRPLLRSLIDTLQACQADKHEIDELAMALDRSFEELALYRRIQKTFRTGTLSSSEMSDIMVRVREILQADLVFGHFPASPDLNITLFDPSLKERLNIDTFTRGLIKELVSGNTAKRKEYFIINNSSSDLVFSPLCERPFRLMVSRAVCNDSTYGWVGAVSFNFYAIFTRSHLNMLQAAASQAALIGTNNHLLMELEGLTAQVKSFKSELAESPMDASVQARHKDRRLADFLDEAFRQLSKSLEASKAFMLRNAQMSTMGQMAAVFAHEIKQPVFALDGLIQITQLKQPDTDDAENLTMMAKAVRRMTRIIQRFESFSRPYERRREPVSLNHIAREVYYLVKPQLEFNSIVGRFERENDLPEIMGDGQGLQQAVLNLVSNAIQAMASNNGQGSELRLKTYSKAQQVCLEVRDNGPGIPKEYIGQVCDPYFTTNPPEKGSGLGLSVVADIVEQHSGRLSIDSLPGKGSRFTIIIPAHAAHDENSEGRPR